MAARLRTSVLEHSVNRFGEAVRVEKWNKMQRVQKRNRKPKVGISGQRLFENDEHQKEKLINGVERWHGEKYNAGY